MNESSQSHELIGSNDDLLTQILRRLPVTSVHRFKSVSKHWLSLLSHRRFTLLFDNVFSSSGPGLFVRDLYIQFDVENQSPSPLNSLNFYTGLHGIKIVQSCNGLILLSSDRGHQHGRDYYVFNTTTKQFSIIPSVTGGQDVHKSIRFMGLAFHQTDFVHYKVICIHRKKPGHVGSFQIQIYSPHTGKWKTSNEYFYGDYFMPFSSGVYWNKAIHWAPSCIMPSYFKLDVEKLLTLPLPSPRPARMGYRGSYEVGVRPLYFGESRGHLHLVETANNENHFRLNVYEMLSDHSGWFVKYQVDFDDLHTTFPEMIHIYQHWSKPHHHGFDVLDFVRGEEDEDTFMVVKISKKIIRYNIWDKSLKHIYDLTNTTYASIGPWEVQRYVIPKP